MQSQFLRFHCKLAGKWHFALIFSLIVLQENFLMPMEKQRKNMGGSAVPKGSAPTRESVPSAFVFSFKGTNPSMITVHSVIHNHGVIPRTEEMAFQLQQDQSLIKFKGFVHKLIFTHSEGSFETVPTFHVGSMKDVNFEFKFHNCLALN